MKKSKSQKSKCAVPCKGVNKYNYQNYYNKLKEDLCIIKEKV